MGGKHSVAGIGGRDACGRGGHCFSNAFKPEEEEGGFTSLQQHAEQKAKRASTTAKEQRAASVQQLAFVAHEDSLAAEGEPQQPVTPAQNMDEHGRCMHLRSEHEQLAAEQEAGQQVAPAEMQQQDTADAENYQPTHHAEEPSVWAPWKGSGGCQMVAFLSRRK